MPRSHFSVSVDAISGSGKTYLASLLLNLLAKKTDKKIIVLDVKEEYVLPSFVKVRLTLSNYRDVMRNFPKLLYKYRRIIVTFNDPDDPRNSLPMDRLIEIGNFFAMVAMKYKNTVIVFEEAELYAPKNKVPHYTKMVATMGRSYGVDSIWIAQRLQQLDTTVRSQANFHIIGKMRDKRDKDLVRPFLGNLAENLDKLPQGHFLIVDPRGRIYLTSTVGWKVPHNG